MIQRWEVTSDNWSCEQLCNQENTCVTTRITLSVSAINTAFCQPPAPLSTENSPFFRPHLTSRESSIPRVLQHIQNDLRSFVVISGGAIHPFVQRRCCAQAAPAAGRSPGHTPRVAEATRSCWRDRGASRASRTPDGTLKPPISHAQ